MTKEIRAQCKTKRKRKNNGERRGRGRGYSPPNRDSTPEPLESCSVVFTASVPRHLLDTDSRVRGEAGSFEAGDHHTPRAVGAEDDWMAVIS